MVLSLGSFFAVAKKEEPKPEEVEDLALLKFNNKPFSQKRVDRELSLLKSDVVEDIADNLEVAEKAGEDVPKALEKMILMARFNELPEPAQKQAIRAMNDNNLEQPERLQVIKNAIKRPNTTFSKVLDAVGVSPEAVREAGIRFKRGRKAAEEKEELIEDQELSIREKVAGFQKEVSETFITGDEDIAKFYIDAALDSPIGAAATHAYVSVKALFSLAEREQAWLAGGVQAVRAAATNDPGKRSRLLRQMEDVVEDVSFGSYLSPMKKPVDVIDIFNEIGNEVKDDKGIQMYTFNKETMETEFNPLQFYLGVQIDSIATTLGFATSFLVPSSLVGTEVLQVGKRAGVQVPKLARRAITKALPVIGKTKKGVATLPKVNAALVKMTKEAKEAAKAMNVFTAKQAREVTKNVPDFFNAAESIPGASKVDAATYRTQAKKLMDGIVQSDPEALASILVAEEAAKKANRVKQIRNDMLVKVRKLQSGDMLLTEKAHLIDDINKLGDDVIELAGVPKDKFFTAQSVDGLVETGMETLSKGGTRYLKSKIKPGKFDFQETQKAFRDTALEAFKDPKKFVESGGIEIFGVKIPLTKWAGSKMSALQKHQSITGKFPGTADDLAVRFQAYTNELNGRRMRAFDSIEEITAGLTKEQESRIMFAVDQDMVGFLDDTIKTSNGMTMRETSKKMKSLNDTLFDESKKIGMEIEYRKNYVTVLNKNEEKMAKHLKESSSKTKTSKDRFANKRVFPSLVDNIKAGLPESQEAFVDRLVNDIISGIKPKESLKQLQKLADEGFGPALDLRSSMTARHTSGAESTARGRLNKNLATDFGIPDELGVYMNEEFVTITGSSDEFKKVRMPKEIRDALEVLDAPTLKQRLKADGKLKTLKLLRAADAMNNFFRTSVTSVFPSFATRNTFSNAFMNFNDIGFKALDPTLHAKIELTLAGKGKNKIFKNKFGQHITGDQMLEAAKNEGLFVSFGQIIDTPGADKWMKDFSPMAFVRRKAFGKHAKQFSIREASTGRENAGRLLNFAANWEQGHSFGGSAQRARKFLIDYGNLTPFERETVTRVVPFYTFFSRNFTNQIETLIKYPRRFFGSQRLVERALIQGPRDVDREVPEFPKDRLGRKFMPIETRQEYDPATDKVVNIARGVVSTGLAQEDLDRFAEVFDSLYGGLRAVWGDPSKDLAKESQRGAKAFAKNLMPSVQIGLGALNTLSGGHLFSKSIAPDISTFTKEWEDQPIWLKRAVGLEFRDIGTPEPLAVINPMANIMFTQLGMGRVLSTNNFVNRNTTDMIDTAMKLIGPISTASINLDEEAMKDLKRRAKAVEGIGPKIKSRISREQKQRQLQERRRRVRGLRSQ